VPVNSTAVLSNAKCPLEQHCHCLVSSCCLLVNLLACRVPIWRVLSYSVAMFWGCAHCDSGEGASIWGENCIELESVWDGGRYETDRGVLEHFVSARVHHSQQTKDGLEGIGTQKIVCLIWPVLNPGLSTQNLNSYSIPRAIKLWNIIKSMFCRMPRKKLLWGLSLLLGCYTFTHWFVVTYGHIRTNNTVLQHQ